MSSPAGRYDQRITVETQLYEPQDQDTIGEPVDRWREFLRCWAAVEGLKGREFFEAQAKASKTNFRIRIRKNTKSDAVHQKMRVRYRSRVLQIEDVIVPLERADEIQLMCSEVKL